MKNIFNRVAFFLMTRSSQILNTQLPSAAISHASAVLEGTPEQLQKFLIENPGAPLWNLGSGRTLLTLAAMRHRPLHAALLLDHGAQIEHRDDILMTPLMWAAHEDVVLYLDAPVKNTPSPTPHQLETVLTLLQRGANPTLKDASDRTAASHSLTKEVKEVLLAAEQNWMARHTQPNAKIAGKY